MKDIQFINWFPDWHWVYFIRSNPIKQPAAFHLIYKWSLHLGFWEIRKFQTEKEMAESLKEYNKIKL